MNFSVKSCFAAAFGLALSLTPLILRANFPATAQKVESSSLSGKYEGTVKDRDGEHKVTLEILEESGKFSGTVTTRVGVFKISKGQMVDGSLTIEFETGGPQRGAMMLRRKGGLLVGKATDGDSAPVELRKIADDEISGEWDAVADASGQPFPFTLTLKLEGEKVTGSSASQLGSSNVSEGSWKDGKLAVILESGNGKIALAATMIDGKLAGEYDFAGQLQGKWVAIRKK